MQVQINPAAAADYPAIIALNEAAVPHVNSISEADLAELAEQAFYFRTARIAQELAGFLLALAPGARYQSLNYRWFCERYDNFIYIDRIVIAPAFGGRGIGRRLYSDLAQTATGRAAALTCEVNLTPPNPVSLGFHRGLGFKEVGQQNTEGGKKRVSLLQMALV